MKTKAIIFDIDSTLSDNRHRQHFIAKDLKKKDWKSFYESMGMDPVKEMARFVCWQFANTGEYQILLVTGRPEEYREFTQDWLRDQWVPYDDLFMRPDGCFDKDTLVKAQIYHEHIKPFFDVKLVLEDRSSVVKMWRALGLECWQVCEGEY